jgi:hypothetical protein
MDATFYATTYAVCITIGAFLGFRGEVEAARSMRTVPTVGGGLLATFDGAALGFIFGALVSGLFDALQALAGWVS